MTKGGRRRTGATIPGVAALAGVSRSTTSRALGGYSAVSPETLAKVRAAAEQLGYRANELARSIITGKTFTIAAVVADIEILKVLLEKQVDGDRRWERRALPTAALHRYRAHRGLPRRARSRRLRSSPPTSSSPLGALRAVRAADVTSTPTGRRGQTRR
jgi:hypothetical protein